MNSDASISEEKRNNVVKMCQRIGKTVIVAYPLTIIIEANGCMK